MKRVSLLFAIIFIFGAFSIVTAQIGEPPPNGQNLDQPRRPNLLQELGLSKEQIQQLRRLNNALQQQTREANRNLQEANQALDQAIYADDINDEIIQQRIKAAQTAQAEVINNRVFKETSIRKILTRDQLIKFRRLRQEFKQKQANTERIVNPSTETQRNSEQRKVPKIQNLPIRRQQQRRVGRPIIP